MAYWLFKSEPETWSWDQQKQKAAQGEPWSGVRNHQAAGNMRAMKKGDLGFFYHSGEERRIVGMLRVIGEYRPDPTDASARFGLVDVCAMEDLPQAVTLAAIRANPSLSEMVLVKNSRLSVQPVTAEEWRLVRAMAGL